MSTTDTTEPVTTPRIVYDLLPNGALTRHDTTQANSKPVAIAGVKDGQLRWAHAEFARFLPPVRRFLAARNLSVEIMPYEVREPVVREAALISDTGGDEPGDTPDPNNGDGPDGMRGLTVDQRKAVNLLRSKEGFPIGEVEKSETAAPRMTSGAGDKTPAFVLWLLRYHPKRFVETYGVDRVGSIEVVIPGKIDPVSHVKGPARRVWEGGHVIARRATILTKVVVNRPEDEKEESL